MLPECIASIYGRIHKVLSEKKVPKVLLNCTGLSERRIRVAEKELGIRLPEDVRDFYKISNGWPRLEIIPDQNIGFMLPLAQSRKREMVETVHGVWEVMNDVIPYARTEIDDIWLKPKGPIERTWWRPSWIPLFDNNQGDHVLIDMNPPKRGVVGQLIDYERLDGPKRIYAKSFRAFLDRFANDLERDLYITEPGISTVVVIKKSVRRKGQAREKEQLRKEQVRNSSNKKDDGE